MPEGPHWMLPGSHERPSAPECRCGAGWDWFEERCTTEPPADGECTDACPEDCTADHKGEQ
jgi:hypothetical protein